MGLIFLIWYDLKHPDMVVQVEEQLDPRLTCLLFSNWAAGNQVARKEDDALVQSIYGAGQVPFAVPARAQSTPNPIPKDETPPPMQSAFQARANERWSDDDVTFATAPSTETEQPPPAAKALNRTQPAITKNSKKWEELREKR